MRSTNRRSTRIRSLANAARWMNVPFRLARPELEKTFLAEAEVAGLTNLAGHRAVGGMRASLYNAMPVAGVQALVEFMRDFERRYGWELMRFKVLTLNGISVKGLDRLPRDRYVVASEIGHPDAILVRSADMHAMEIPAGVLAVGRAGAGTNNIPVAQLTGARRAGVHGARRECECGEGTGARGTVRRGAPPLRGLGFRARPAARGRGARSGGRAGQEALHRPRTARTDARRGRPGRDRRRGRECRTPAGDAGAGLRPADHGAARLAALVRRRAGAEPGRPVCALRRRDGARTAHRRRRARWSMGSACA